jgi:hypothetical protein
MKRSDLFSVIGKRKKIAHLIAGHPVPYTDFGKNLALGMIRWLQEAVHLLLPVIVLVILMNKFKNFNGQIHGLRLCKATNN